MSVLQAIVLGVVQGITEFLPISSTGHLRLIPRVMHWHDAGVTILSIDPISTSGSEERAFDELFETFARI